MANNTPATTPPQPLFWLKDDKGKPWPVTGSYGLTTVAEQKELQTYIRGGWTNTPIYKDYGVSPYWRRYQDWNITLIGNDVSGIRAPAGIIVGLPASPDPTGGPDEVPPTAMRVWLERAHHRSNPRVWAEINHLRSGSAASSIGWNTINPPPPDEIIHARLGFQLLSNILTTLTIPGGRTPGSGQFTDGRALRTTLVPIVIALHKQGLWPSQQRVTEYLRRDPLLADRRREEIDPRVLRRWVKGLLGLSWKEFLESLGIR